MRLVLATTLATCAALAGGCGGGGSNTSSIPSDSTSGKTASTSTAVVSKAPPGCLVVPSPKPKNVKLPAPTTKLDASKTYIATVRTNCGTFKFELAVKDSPNTSASIEYLASKRFYDHTIFHRIVPNFVIQGGDPTGSGQGGPGYSVVDKPPPNTKYTTGVVAMAKTGSDPPGTAGSQFFVVTGKDAGLPADYAVAGKVVSGMNVVQRIGKLGDQSEQPTAVVEIQRFRVAAR